MSRGNDFKLEGILKAKVLEVMFYKELIFSYYNDI